MSATLKYKLTRVVVAIWPLVPVSVKGALYRRHRAKIEGRTSIFVN